MDTSLSLPEKQIDLLKDRTPDAFIQEKPGRGGKALKYVDIGYVTAKLNQIFGHIWSFEVVREGLQGKHIWSLGRLKVMLKDGTVITKEQYGSAEVYFVRGTQDPVSLGDSFKSAASDSLKKCASMLGLACDVYAPKVWETTAQLKKQLGKEIDSIATND